MSNEEYDSKLEEDMLIVLETVAENRESIEELVTATDTLERSGVLDLLAVVGTRDHESNEQLYEAFAEDPANFRAVQNLSLLAGGLSRIDPEAFAAIVDGTVSAEDFADPPEAGLLGILQQLRDPDVRRGLGIVFLILKSIGSRPESTPAGAGSSSSDTGRGS